MHNEGYIYLKCNSAQRRVRGRKWNEKGTIHQQEKFTSCRLTFLEFSAYSYETTKHMHQTTI